jgi:CRISPR-associated protein (TIGR03986 family)
MQRRIAGYLVCSGRTEIPTDDPTRKKIRETVFAPPSARPHDALPMCPAFMALFHALNSDPGRVAREPRGNWRFWLAAMGWLDAFRAERREDDPDPVDYRLYPGIPVFYHGDPALARDDEGPPIAERGFFIGLTRVLRLPWPYSVGEVADRLYRGRQEHHRYELPRLGEENGWDFARALFGEVDDANLDPAVAEARRKADTNTGTKPQALAGRIAFGPAFAEGDPQPERTPHEGVFGAPRESYFPFYLARAADAEGPGSQRYDDPDAIPAGRKRYAVRRRTDELPQGNDNDKVKTKVHFLPEGTRFTGRIRYHNLHPVELGALLWSLSFGRPGGPYRHQLGRAKAQGYGVLRADVAFRKPQIVNGADIKGDPQTIETYLAAFRSYMTGALGEQGGYEQQPQITALRRMADPDIGEPAKAALATPSLDEYQQWKRNFGQRHPPGSPPLLQPI